MRSVLVTGGNQGIGFALCKQLAVDHNCNVILTARNPERGQAAVSKINDILGNNPSSQGSAIFIPLDTSSDASFAAAVEETRAKLPGGKKLYGIVNNAGIGLNTGGGDILNTNLYGPKRVCESFFNLLDQDEGRIVNLGSGSGPMYCGSCNSEEKKMLCSPDSDAMTWDFIEQHAKQKLNRSDAYGLSKALVACYSGLLARMHPNILTSCVTPGFIDTQMTAGWGASKSPEQGTLAIKKCLFEDLPGNGYYYGSDGIRSPYHFMRNPGEPEYNGVNPFL